MSDELAVHQLSSSFIIHHSSLPSPSPLIQNYRKGKTMSKKFTNGGKPTIVPVEKLHFFEHNHLRQNTQIFCHSLGRIEGEQLAREIGVRYDVIKQVLDGIVHVLRCGYEPVLGTSECGVRFYPMLSHDYKNMTLCGHTVGSFRRRLDGLHADCRRGMTGEVTSDTEIEGSPERREKEQTVERAMAEMACVTPDTVVACPKCGEKFRVGKCLCGQKW